MGTDWLVSALPMCYVENYNRGCTRMKEIRHMARKIFEPFQIVIENYDLFAQSLIREVVQKYRGSYLGILWNFILPLVMLVVYSFIFGVIFQARWDQQRTDSRAEFALILFVGITLYNVFSETVSASPTLIICNSNYVKKVIYPLEILSMTSIGASLVQLFFNLIIILVGKAIIIKQFDIMVLLFPIVLIPLLFLTLGISWILSGVGVFVRDMRQAATIIVLIFGYITPVFYPLSSVPEGFRGLMYLNPMTSIVDNARRVLIYNEFPKWDQYCITFVISYLVMWIGFYFFRKVKPNFSDAI